MMKVKGNTILSGGFAAALVAYILLIAANQGLAQNDEVASGGRAQKILETKDPRQESPKIFDQGRSMKDMIKELASDQALHDAMKQVNEEVNEKSEQRSARYATGNLDTVPEGIDRNERVRNRIRENSQKKAAQMLSKAIGVDTILAHGLEFNLTDFGSKEQNTNGTSANSNVRYGLIADEIVPAKEQQLTADQNGIDGQNVESAGKAKVKWNVGPLKEEAQHFAPVSVAKSTDNSLPSADFKGKITAREGSSLQDSTATASALPPMRIGIHQEESLYRVEYLTQENFKKETTVHGVQIPVKGTFKVDREMDVNFRPTKTSALGLMLKENTPRLDVHYLNMDQRYEGQFHVNRGYYELNLKAQSASPVKDEGPKYELGISTGF